MLLRWLGGRATQMDVRTTLPVALGFTVASIYGFLSTYSYHYIFYTLLIPVYLICRGFYRFVAGFAACVLYMCLDNSSPYLVIPVSTMVFADYLAGSGPREKLLMKSIVTTLIYVPVYIVVPQAVIPAIAVIGSAVIALFAEYVELSVFRVEAIKIPQLIYLGDSAEIELEVHGRGRAIYEVHLDGKLVEEGFINDVARIRLFIKPDYAGIHIYAVQIGLRGRRGLAQLLVKSFSIKLRVIPRYTAVSRRARALLAKYIHEVGVPTVLYARISAEHRVSKVPAPYHLAASLQPKWGRQGPQQAVYHWTTPYRIYQVLEEVIGRALRGEYIGAREYVPGDSPRDIHWKKSVCLNRLVVKEYGASSTGEAGHPVVVVADWMATNAVELDMLIELTYWILLSNRASKIVVLKVPSGGLYLIRGRYLDIIAAIESILMIEDIRALFNYESWSRSRMVVNTVTGGGVLEELIRYYELQAYSLIGELEKQGAVRGTPFYTIYSKSLSFKYAVFTRCMGGLGYKPAPLKLYGRVD